MSHWYYILVVDISQCDICPAACLSIDVGSKLKVSGGGVPLDKYKQFSSVLKILNSVYVCGWGGGVTAVHCGNLKVSLECYCAQVNC